MRRLTLFASMLALAAIGHAQAAADSALIGVRVERFPSFPGGEAALYRHLSRETRMPEAALEAGIRGSVYVTFLVDTAGGIHDAEMKRGLGHGCDEEALRMVRGMPPWQPGTVHGKPVAAWFVLPIRFDERTRRR